MRNENGSLGWRAVFAWHSSGCLEAELKRGGSSSRKSVVACLTGDVNLLLRFTPRELEPVSRERNPLREEMPLRLDLSGQESHDLHLSWLADAGVDPTMLSDDVAQRAAGDQSMSICAVSR